MLRKKDWIVTLIVRNPGNHFVLGRRTIPVRARTRAGAMLLAESEHDKIYRSEILRSTAKRA